MLHLDETRVRAIETARRFLERHRDVERLLLLDDLFGQLRAVLWCRAPERDAPGEARREAIARELAAQLGEVATPYWPGEERGLYRAWNDNPADRDVYEQGWEEGEELDGVASGRLRIAERYRNRGAWLRPDLAPPWESPSPSGGPAAAPVVVFYSFKGGVGRSTALAAFAIQRARRGERVLAIDADLDAPGLGALLGADREGGTAPWGLVDYWLERPLFEAAGAVRSDLEFDLGDYVHLCRRGAVVGEASGDIAVVPAGNLHPPHRESYFGKLARLDFEPPPRGDHPAQSLLRALREAYEPDWILIDARAGLAEAAGLWLGGLAQLHVVFATGSEPGWGGLSLVIEHLGGSRRGLPQRECVLVQCLVPRDAAVSRAARQAFAERARDEFATHYYRPEWVEEAEGPWTLDDLDSDDAPHSPLVLSYEEKLAHFGAIDDVADFLADSPEFRALGERIAERCGAGSGGRR